MAQIKTQSITNWNNYHFNGPYPTKQLLDIDTDRSISSLVERYNDCSFALQQLIAQSLAKGEGLRAFGSAWSLSNIAHHCDRMLYTGRLNIRIPLETMPQEQASTSDAASLFFFQCGNTVKELHEYLLKRRKSLRACGASNGQTIAGAISTGVHGAAIDLGSIQDSVVGIQLITGPEAEHLVYIERASSPVMNEAFADSIHCQLVRNDELFNAALVSLGSFGIIHGLVMECDEAFLLKRYVKKINKPAAMAISSAMDFTAGSFRIAEEVGADGGIARPYHFKLYVNPYNAEEDFVTEVVYRKEYRADYPDPIPFIKKTIYKDIPSWVAEFAAKHKRLIPKMVKALRSEAFPKVDDVIEGTLGEIFWDTAQSSDAFGCAFGLALADAAKALDLFIELMNKKGPIPGILSMRFVKGSQATLAFTRFDITCVLEVDGIPWKANKNMIGLEPFLAEVVRSFQLNNIRFTLHWGKNAPWSMPGLVNYMYDSAATKWMMMRSVLLSPKMAEFFSNDFLRMVKLADYHHHLPASLHHLRKQIVTIHA